MVGAEMLRGLASVRPLVELFNRETNRKRVDGPLRLLLHQAGDDRRVDAAGEKRSEWHIAAHPQANRFGQCAAKFALPAIGRPRCRLIGKDFRSLRDFGSLIERRLPVTANVEQAVLEDSDMSRR